MPLTDVTKGPRPNRFSQGGTIRLGEMVKSARTGNMHPFATDHFIFKDAPDLGAYFGDNCKELPVVFPFADFDRNISAFYRVWAGGVNVCRGDGERVLSALPFETEEKRDGRASVKRAKGYVWVQHGQVMTPLKWGDQEFQPGAVIPCPGSSDQGRYPHTVFR